MTGNIYLDLTNEFNDGDLRAILSSGQAVVLHRLALSSKDGDWIVREAPDDLNHILEILQRHGARYRLGAPLDVRWMSGAWSAHFEFASNNTRVRCDFVTRPPRLCAEDLQLLWDEQERGENGNFPVPTIDGRRLSELKKTDRERDYPFIGELARRMPLQDQLLLSRSALDLLELVKSYPEEVAASVSKRPLLGLLLEPTCTRRTIQLALSEEQIDMMEKNEVRLAAFGRAARKWQALWPKLQKEARGLPLLQAHQLLIQRAVDVLPENPHE